MMQDEFYMHRALELAERGRTLVAPNPMVGAVLVYEDRIIGEGYHRQWGQPHAEVNAIASVKEVELLPLCTMYVSLEPCSHYGKTPPCAKLIIDKQIPRVVIGMKDPHDKVAGKGIKMLEDAGVKVIVGVCEQECQELNKRFVTYFTQRRPYVILKWAESSDGFIDSNRDSAEKKPVRLSNEVTKTLNHQIRTQEAAILVGTNTALLDNPHLTSRKWGPKNAVRVLLDRQGRVPRSYHFFDDSTRTLILTCETTEARLPLEKSEQTKYVRLTSEALPQQILKRLYEEELTSVIIEGGKQLLETFIEAGLWDECRIETAPILLHEGVSSPKIEGRLVSCTNILGQTFRLLTPKS